MEKRKKCKQIKEKIRKQKNNYKGIENCAKYGVEHKNANFSIQNMWGKHEKQKKIEMKNLWKNKEKFNL